MADTVLRQCHFCEDWFRIDQVTLQKLEKYPSSSFEEAFACENCLKTSRIERLTARAVKALEHGGFNEIEVTEGNLKVHLIRFTPMPYYTAPWAGPYQYQWPPHQP